LSDVPREKIPWYPTIDYEKCTSCLTCVGFCRNGVYATKGNPGNPLVANPYNCVVGCSSCETMCPNGAISFPSREEIVELIKRLRREMSSG
jgi:NAD-dependent dihydropyrimidine dehydrogenase PreA subunit